MKKYVVVLADRAAPREKVEREIGGLQVEAEWIGEEARELAGEVPF